MTQPYKCPTCSGRKRVDGEPCPTCEATGVVWAPPNMAESGELAGQDALDLTYDGR